MKMRKIKTLVKNMDQCYKEGCYTVLICARFGLIIDLCPLCVFFFSAHHRSR